MFLDLLKATQAAETASPPAKEYRARPGQKLATRRNEQKARMASRGHGSLAA